MCPVADDEASDGARPHGRQAGCSPSGSAGCRAIRSSRKSNFDVVRDAETRRREDRRGDRRARRSKRLKDAHAQVRDGRSRQPRVFPARLLHLARQRAAVVGQGPRVLPQALPRHAHNAIAEEVAKHDVKDVDVARQGRAREDGPGRGPELPHGHVGALLGHRSAGRDLLREERPQLDGHAQRSSTRCRRPCRRAGSRRATGRSSRASPQRHARAGAERYLPEPVKDIVVVAAACTTRRRRSRSRPSRTGRKGECEADSRQDDAEPHGRDARLHASSTTGSSRSGRNFRDNGLAVHGTHYDVDDALRRVPDDAPDRDVGRQDVPVAARRQGRLRRHPALRRRDQRRAGLPRLTRRSRTRPASTTRTSPRDTRAVRMHLRGPHQPAATHADDAVLDRHHQRGRAPTRRTARTSRS